MEERILTPGTFTGIYSSEDGRPLYYTGIFSRMTAHGLPCVFLSTDQTNPHPNTLERYTQQTLAKLGWTIKA